MIDTGENSAESTENQLIRLLAKFRLRNDREARARGVTEEQVDKLTENEIGALPESAIVHIVDTFLMLRKKGMSEPDIIKRIELQRSLFGQNDELPDGITIRQYIKRRIRSEFVQIARLDERVIDMEILLAVKWFSDELKSAKDWQRVIAMAKAKQRKPAAPSTQAARPSAPAAVPVRPEVADVGQPHPVAETDESPSGSRWPWLLPVAAAVAMVVASAGYWLFFMGGLTLIG